MQLTVDYKSYAKALITIERLLDSDIDVMLRLTSKGRAALEASNEEGWIRVLLDVVTCEGKGTVFTRLKHLRALKTKAKTITFSYEPEEQQLCVRTGKTKGFIGIVDSDNAEILAPEETINLVLGVPEKALQEATRATIFKPLLSTSAAVTALCAVDQELHVSSYDVYVGTHYSKACPTMQAGDDFALLMESAYWKTIASQIGDSDEVLVKLGASTDLFRVKSTRFDLYYATIDEENNDVLKIITGLKEEAEGSAVFVVGELLAAINEINGILKGVSKTEASLTLTFEADSLSLKAVSNLGTMQTEIATKDYAKEEPTTFNVSADSFHDVLNLLEANKKEAAVARMLLFENYIILESLKNNILSISPVLAD